MKALLICPTNRPEVSQWARFAPLAAIPLLGESLVEYWLAHLAEKGFKEVCVLADDRPEQIGDIVGNGARWGIAAEVMPESRELAPAQAQLKYAPAFPSTAPENMIVTLDHFPGVPQWPLFHSYAGLYSALMGWIPQARTVERVGMRELKPGVWAGTRSRVARNARLQAPCWIGQNVYVGAHAVVGPMAVVEDRAFIEDGAEVTNSVVGPDTFVGKPTSLRDLFVWGASVVNWKTGVTAEIREPFLLSALRQPPFAARRENVFNRIFEVLFEEDKQPATVLEKLLNEPGQQGRLT